MILANQEIEKRVRIVAKELIKASKTKAPTPSEEIMIESLILLVVNTLQNLNNIAYGATYGKS